MSRTRLELQEELEEVLGSRNVYYRPPESVKIKYPCIIYDRDNDRIRFADDGRYLSHKRYSLTVIDPDPDSKIPESILEHFRMCSHVRSYTSNNLNHDVLNLYY